MYLIIYCNLLPCNNDNFTSYSNIRYCRLNLQQNKKAAITCQGTNFQLAKCPMHGRHLVKSIMISYIFSDHLHDTACFNDHTSHTDMLTYGHDKFILNKSWAQITLFVPQFQSCTLVAFKQNSFHSYYSYTMGTPCARSDKLHGYCL